MMDESPRRRPHFRPRKRPEPPLREFNEQRSSPDLLIAPRPASAPTTPAASTGAPPNSQERRIKIRDLLNGISAPENISESEGVWDSIGSEEDVQLGPSIHSSPNESVDNPVHEKLSGKMNSQESQESMDSVSKRAYGEDVSNGALSEVVANASDDESDNRMSIKNIEETSIVSSAENSADFSQQLPSSLLDTIDTPFSASQARLMEYLRSRNWPVMTMNQYLQKYGVPLHEKDLALHERDLLHYLLNVYVVSAHSGSPSSLPRSLDSFAIRGTSFAAEIDTGFWDLLTKLVGPEVVTYFVQKCRIYRPFHASNAWIDLTLGKKWFVYYNWETLRQKMRIPLAKERSVFGSVSKQPIMYSRPSITRREITETESKDPLLAVAARRLQKFADLSSGTRLTFRRRVGWTPTKTVASFVSQHLRRLLPTSLLGSHSNHAAFYRSVAKYLKTPGKSQTNVAVFSHGIRMKEIPWMANIPEAERQQELIYRLRWLVIYIVHPLLSLHFYITEMSGRPTTIYYYEHGVWHNEFESQGHKALENDEKVDDEVEAAQMRFVPKINNTVRPIINLKHFNKCLQSAHYVLHELTLRKYPRLRTTHSWLSELYSFRSKSPPNARFFAVKADLGGCYENANVSTVKVLLAKLLEDEHVYKVEHIRAFDLDRDTIRDKTVATVLPEKINDEIMRAQPEGPPEIIGEFPNSEFITSADILRLTHTLLDGLCLKTGKQENVLFTHGIPQGSSISLELCNILLEEMIQNELDEFVSKGLLLRYVDDFLFVTTNKDLAQKFLDRMMAGFVPVYGQFCRPEKIVTNLEYPTVTKFLGLDLCLDTLDVLLGDIGVFRMALDSPQVRLTDMRKRLNLDVLKLLEPIRILKRNGLGIPQKLLNKSLVRFGEAMAQRMPFYLRVYHDSSSKTLLYRMIHRYFREFATGNEWKRVCRSVVRRYCQEKRAIPLQWRRFPAKRRRLAKD